MHITILYFKLKKKDLPTLIVACLLMTSSDKGVSLATSFKKDIEKISIINHIYLILILVIEKFPK